MVCKWRLDSGQIEVIDEAVVDALRRMTVTQRVAAAFDANRMARDMLFTSIKTRNPEWSETAIKAEVA